MSVVLVTSRSFGTVSEAGLKLLCKAGFVVKRVPEEERPLDSVEKLIPIVQRDQPEVIISGAEPVTAAVLAASRQLRMVMKHGVGVDNIDLDAATSRGIFVANAPGTNTEAVADLTVGLILSLLRKICLANEATRSGRWERFMGHELRGITVGIVGTGRIGAAVARRLIAFGTDLLAYDVVRNTELERHVTYTSLKELLQKADVVTLHVPLTFETQRMIGRTELDLMKKTAFLVNTARGELVDEDALYQYLKSGRIAGAALDVFTSEPPRNNPLLELDNVIVTPHIGAYTYEAMEAMDRLCAETIIDVLCEGKVPENVLNPQAQSP